METKSWTIVDKSDWGDGPWQDEPDKMQWTDEATGLPCLVVRAHSGALCGYVGAPDGHPWHKAKPYDISHHVSVHGGLNFGSFCDEKRGICHVVEPGEPDNVWWLGFDCGHLWDKKPGNDALLRRVAAHLEEMRQELSVGILAETYRDLAYVRDQCHHLARQIHERTEP